MNRVKPSQVSAYQFWRFLEHFFGGKQPAIRFKSQRTAIQKRVANELKLSSKAVTKQVPRVKDISTKELIKNYRDKGIPVILEGKAKNWDCVKLWSPDWLLENFGNDDASLFDASSQNMDKIDYSVEKTTLRKVLLAMKEGDTTKYSRFNTLLYDHPELIEDFDWKWLYKMRNLISFGKTFQVFIGAKNTKTSLHASSEHNIFTQVYGKKHWYIYQPEYELIFDPPINRTVYFHSAFDPDSLDFDAFPAAKFITTWECVLEPGDVLFNPPNWWHQVTNTENSIGVGFRWFNFSQSAKQSLVSTLLTLFSTNPPIWVANKNKTNFAKVFEYMGKKAKK